MNALISFPRSGNTLFRIIIEYITRHTVMNKHPSLVNRSINHSATMRLNLKKELNLNLGKKEILFKSHLLNLEQKRLCVGPKLNLILRNYNDAINSHLSRIENNKGKKDRFINLYCDIIKHYDKNNKLFLIHYEDIIDLEKQKIIVKKFIEKNNLENIAKYYDDYVKNIKQINQKSKKAYTNLHDNKIKKITEDHTKQVYNKLGKELFERYLENYKK